MGNKLVLTRMEDRLYSCLFSGDELIGLHAEDTAEESILGNIYLGQVKNIVKNIAAAFVEIGGGILGYLPLDENKNPIYAGKKTGIPSVGDELFVQVIKEAAKNKGPALSSNLNFTGKYLVLTHGKPGVGISSKIKGKKERERLAAVVGSLWTPAYGYIVRTNAAGISGEILEEEARRLYADYETLKKTGIHRTPFSLICPAVPGYIKDIRDSYDKETDSYITDDPEVYEAIRPLVPGEKLTFYEDPSLPLCRLCGLEEKLKRALSKKVWLKSGGYLVIEPTEALTVIDVNTGKAVNGHSNKEDNYYRVNREAALELAKQIRLRNLSGIIIVDFIDMELPEHRQSILHILEERFAEDPVKTILVDMTELGLVEITRKKIRRPLGEQINTQIV